MEPVHDTHRDEEVSHDGFQLGSIIVTGALRARLGASSGSRWEEWSWQTSNAQWQWGGDNWNWWSSPKQENLHTLRTEAPPTADDVAERVAARMREAETERKRQAEEPEVAIPSITLVEICSSFKGCSDRQNKKKICPIVKAKLDDSFEEFLLDLVTTRSSVGRKDKVLALCRFFSAYCTSIRPMQTTLVLWLR